MQAFHASWLYNVIPTDCTCKVVGTPYYYERERERVAIEIESYWLHIRPLPAMALGFMTAQVSLRIWLNVK